MKEIQNLIQSYLTAYFSTLNSRKYKALDARWKEHKKKLLERVKEFEQWHILRDLSLLMIYYGTPIGAKDLCAMTPEDIVRRSEDSIHLIIRPTSDTDRYILLDQETREVLEEYLEHCTVEQELLFLSDAGEALSTQDIFALSNAYPNHALVSELRGFFPVYQQSDYEVIPTPLRLNAVSRYSGKGVTIAFLDSGFYPHPDLTTPDNRVLAYINIPHPEDDDFGDPSDNSWHGMQTSVSAAGNGYLSDGLYKGIAYQSNLVLLKASDRQGQITTEYMIKGLKWVLEHHEEYNIRIVNISLGEGREASYLDNALNQMAEALTQAGIVVVVAAGNDGSQFITPPANAPSVITVGGFDDNNNLSQHQYGMYHSSYGPTIDGLMKPEVIAPGIWVAAPILPETHLYAKAEAMSQVSGAENPTELAREHLDLMPFDEPVLQGDAEYLRQRVLEELKKEKIVGTHYQHVDGTSFAAPIVCSIIAQMLQANPRLTPRRIKQILCSTTDKIFNIPIDKQGYGLIHPRKSVKEAENDLHRKGLKRPDSPFVAGREVSFYYRSKTARSVALVGEFTQWGQNPEYLEKIPNSNTWFLKKTFPFKGVYTYKFLVDDTLWSHDPECDNLESDGFGGYNTRLNIYLD